MSGATRLWFRVHSFTGVITGLLLFVLCWSGTFAVFDHELDWLTTPEARVQPDGDSAGWDAWMRTATRAYPQGRVVGMQAPAHDSDAVVALIQRPDQPRRLVYINPYTGELRGTASAFNIHRFFRNFHRSFFFPTQWGTYLVALLAVTLLLSLIAGLMFYRRWWTRFFSIATWRRPAVWSELHKLAGLWSVWFVLIIAATGIWYGVERFRLDFGDGIFAYAGNGDLALNPIPRPGSDPAPPLLSLPELISAANRERPDLNIRTIVPAPGLLYLEGQAGHILVRDRANHLYLDARGGTVLYSQSANDLPLYWRWSETADPLHFGDFAGLASKTVWFVFGLLLCGLILTGTWIHARRLGRSARSRQRHRWPGTLPAVVVSAVVLAASLPFALHEIRTLYGDAAKGAQQLPALSPGVTGVILGWIVLTLIVLFLWAWTLRRTLQREGRPSKAERHPEKPPGKSCI